jgi:hypothetical protein
MYTVKLDLHLTYTPPMREATPPIVLTRDLVLPFPAADGMKVHSEAMDPVIPPLGLVLEDVIWDMDREVFRATTSIADLPPNHVPAATRVRFMVSACP